MAESPEHKEVREKLLNFLIKACGNRYIISRSHSTSEVGLPILEEKFRSEILYKPDIVLQRKSDKNITHIIEIEDKGDIVEETKRKLIFADFCLSIMTKKGSQKHDIKPRIFFVTLQNLTKTKLNAAKDRIKFLENYLTMLSKPNLNGQEETVEKLKKELQ